MRLLRRIAAAAAAGMLCCVTAFAEEEALPAAALVNSGIPCESAILVEQTTGRILFEKNVDEPLAPASITKLMTLLLAMEAIDRGELAIGDAVICTPHAASMGGSQIWLEAGEEMTVDELLRATAIASANDAACALAEHLAGSEEAFVAAMNERAAALGMKNTVFRNCTGLDAEGHLTTARDISILSRELLAHPLIRQYTTVWTDTLRNGETELTNTNKLVRYYEGTTGLKTGTTADAKYCLAASAERDGLSLVAVVLAAPSGSERFGAARGLLDYGFANYRMIETPLPALEPDRLPVSGGTARSVGLRIDAPARLLVSREQREITPRVTLAEGARAPVAAGDALGECEFGVRGVVLGVFPIVAAESVEKMTFPAALGLSLRTILSMGRTEFPQ